MGVNRSNLAHSRTARSGAEPRPLQQYLRIDSSLLSKEISRNKEFGNGPWALTTSVEQSPAIEPYLELPWPNGYNRLPENPSGGEGVRGSHLTLTAGSTDKPGFSRPMKSGLCGPSKSMRTGTRCPSATDRVGRLDTEGRTGGPA